ncbi:MAG: hypothetical protein KatS3mg105_2188 [Gemmatales bacterium]|nr:MAG: hypothetical protein KatS3mg105_2188 [Gemmatales bacterium]
MIRFLIAYDIADPRRLQRVARQIEKKAVRVQKSVFLFFGDAKAANTLLDETVPLLDLKEDIIQAWRLADGQPPEGLVRGLGYEVHPLSVVAADDRPRTVDRSLSSNHSSNGQ